MRENVVAWFAAVRCGDLESVSRLCDLGVPADELDETEGSITALALAVKNQSTDIVKYLIGRGANPNIKLSGGATILMWAAEIGNLEVVATLLKCESVAVNLKDEKLKRALDYAIRNGHAVTAALLRSHGAIEGIVKTVLVLGAGFTKSFMSDAPLLVDDFDIQPRLTEKYKDFKYASAALQAELGRYTDGRIDIERLMTRLAGGMPYDRDHESVHELTSLLADIKTTFLDRIRLSVSKPVLQMHDLERLAVACLMNRLDIITFNYDDLLDEALWDASSFASQNRWNPNTGYGFICGASDGITLDEDIHFRCSTQILKLHGSINWRARLGATEPYRLADIVHHEKWWLRGTPGRTIDGNHMNFFDNRLPLMNVFANQLEREPFIVPPVLSKSAMNDQPVLRRTWSAAFEAIREAEKIVFIGYSLPLTDIASNYLFAEAVQASAPRPDITVVDFAADNDTEKRRLVVNAYRKVFPEIGNDSFRFDGAIAWAKDFVQSQNQVSMEDLDGWRPVE